MKRVITIILAMAMALSVFSVAYAENGEMAHKDEFRHATDEEIKAGKRLEVS